MAEPITEEDFAIWRESPVTRWVLDGVAHVAAEQERIWKARAWGGQLDPIVHANCTARADAYDGLAKVTFDQIHAIHNPDEEPTA